MDTFADKIKGLEAEISSISDRIQAAQELIERLKPEVEELETALKEAKKVVALDSSSDNRRAVETLRKKLDKAESDLDESVILAEALSDRKQQLESELKSVRDALQGDESERLIAKAKDLAEVYNASIRAAFDAAVRLQLITNGVQQRRGHTGLAKLGEVCGKPCSTGAFNLLFEGFPLFEPGNGGYPKMLRTAYQSQEDRATILAELLTV